MIFSLFISFLILLRIGELLLSRGNEQWLLQKGAIEYGQNHYPFMIMLHTLFILSLIVEYILISPDSYNAWLMVLFFILLILKTWCISSLGRFWVTKIYRVPDIPLIKKGPYKYMNHPNYIIVIAEIATIPLIFNLYYTAAIYSILNSIMMIIRIREENKVLINKYHIKR